MYQFPMSFKVQTKATAGIAKTWSTSTSDSQSLNCAIPPEFMGPGGGYSPEDFYALALSNCFVATFKVFAQNSKLEYKEILINSDLIVDRNEKGAPWMAKMVFQVRLEGVSNSDLAERVLQKTKAGCLILNSVNTEKLFEFTIS